MDLYYPESEGSDRFRREVLRIDAPDDAGAEAEGKRIDAWRKPGYFIVRAIQTSARSGDRVIYTSQIEKKSSPDETLGDTTISVAP